MSVSLAFANYAFLKWRYKRKHVGVLITIKPFVFRSVNAVYCTFYMNHSICVSPLLLDVPTGTLASPRCQVAPASPVIAMAIWTYLYLAAVIQSQDSVCAAVKVMEAQAVTVAPKVTMEMPSQPKTANVSKQTNKKRCKTCRRSDWLL